MKRRILITIAILLMLTLAGCRPEPPRGVVYVVDDDFTTRAYYRPVLEGEEVRFGDPIALPLDHPVDLPVFSPEGGVLWAFSADDDDRPGIYRLTFEAAGPVGEAERMIDLTPYPAATANSICPASGGRVFFDARVPETESWQLFVYEDGGIAQLTEGEADREVPVVSPDGARLVFSSNDDGTGGRGEDFDLWCYELAAGELKLLVELPGHQGSPCFAADGRLYFNTGGIDGPEDYDLAYLDVLDDVEPDDVSYLPDIGGLEMFPRPALDGRLLLISVLDEDGWNAIIYDADGEGFRSLGHPDGPQVIYAGWRPPTPTE